MNKEVKEELCNLSTELYKAKWRWEKMLYNGLTEQTPNSKETHIETRFGKRILREYSQRYFTLDSLLTYMRDLKVKLDEAKKPVDKKE